MYAGRRGRRPLPCTPPCPHPTSCRHHMVGRDVLGAPRPRDAHGTPTGTPRVRGPPGTSAPTMPHPCPHPTSCRHHMVGRDVLGAPRTQDAHGNATCTRAAGDVGPYHASPMSTPHALSTPMVGRDVLGAPRPRDAHGTPTGMPHVRGPPRTSAPTMPHPCPRPTPCRHHMVGRDVLGAPRTRDAHGTHTGRPRERPRGRHVYAGRRGRRPLPCLTHVYTPTSCPYPTSGPHPW